MATLTDLSAFGPKHIGTAANLQARQYVQSRFGEAGLKNVHTESFDFPRWSLDSSRFSVSVDGATTMPGYDVFEASGSGQADGAVVWCNTAHPSDLASLDLTGKVALVVRDDSYHRSAQYLNVTQAGAVAMLYISQSPSNLRQVGSVRFDWEAEGGIPAITVGEDDGNAIQAAVAGGHTVTASIDVATSSTPSMGANVVGTVPGKSSAEIVLGAHYDTWFDGATDNGSGVAELLALAERYAHAGRPEYTLVFVAYDGEEVALYGGYAFLRAHDIVAHEQVLAYLNFETPSALDPSLIGLGSSNQPVLQNALNDAGELTASYPLIVGLEVVAQVLGGIIPTDNHGMDRSWLPTVSTAVNGPYYHTDEDTPDKVDLPLLAQSTDGFVTALDLLLADATTGFAVVDTKLWRVTTTVGTGDPLGVTVLVTDGTGAAMAGATVSGRLLVDDFTDAGSTMATTDATGHAQLTFGAGQAQAGSGSRFVHVTAGMDYPLCERITALP